MTQLTPKHGAFDQNFRYILQNMIVALTSTKETHLPSLRHVPVQFALICLAPHLQSEAALNTGVKKFCTIAHLPLVNIGAAIVVLRLHRPALICM